MDEIKLSRPQSAIYLDKNRFRVVVAGRRFGKSFLSGMELLNAAIGSDKATGAKLKKQTVAYIAPTFPMAKQIMWVWLKEYAPKNYIKKQNETEMLMEFNNGSKIILKSAENYDSLRGLSLSFVVMDEVTDIHPDCWSLVVRPALSDQEGGALFIGTPKGTNHFYDWYTRGLSDDEEDAAWSSFSYTTLQGGYVSAEEVKSARYDLSATEFKQEYEASFDSLSDKVYKSYDENNRANIPDPGGPVHIGLDFNIRRMTAVCDTDNKMQCEIFKTIAISQCNTRQMCEAIQAEFPGREIHVYPDPAGGARSTKAESGVTDHTILKDHGFIVHLPKGQLKIKDRVNSVNAIILNGEGDRRLFVDYKCEDLDFALSNQQYDTKTEQPDKKTKGHIDDILDGLGYLINLKYPLIHIYDYAMSSKRGIGRIK